MKSDKTIIRKIHMEQLHFITKLLDIKDPNIKILDIINMDTHKEIIAKLDYEAPSCPDCGSLMKKYDFQKPSKIPYLETTGMPSRILLRKRRFKCYHCSKMMVAETPLVKKNHQIPRIINQKIAQKLIEKISMTDIAHQLNTSQSLAPPSLTKINDRIAIFTKIFAKIASSKTNSFERPNFISTTPEMKLSCVRFA
ncbi:degenerate transposase [Streptococcus pneumoniae]|nr:degenerate transposase [Streptococcus pneumoniae]